MFLVIASLLTLAGGFGLPTFKTEISSSYMGLHGHQSSRQSAQIEPCEIRVDGEYYLHMDPLQKLYTYNISSPWKDVVNATLSPNPPRLDELVKTCIDGSFMEDVWALTMQGNATIEGTPFVYRVDKTFCDFRIRPNICPAHKGEILHFEEEYNIALPKGTYSVVLAVFNQDDEMVVTFTIKNCTIT